MNNTEKAALLDYSRLIWRFRDKNPMTEPDERAVERCVKRINELTGRLDTLTF